MELSADQSPIEETIFNINVLGYKVNEDSSLVTITDDEDKDIQWDQKDQKGDNVTVGEFPLEKEEQDN